MRQSDSDLSPALAEYRNALLARARRAIRRDDPLPLHLVAQLEDIGVDVEALELSTLVSY